MKTLQSIRSRLAWLVHAYKALFRHYHRQLVPLFEIILEHDDLVMDVGAHAGQFTKIFSRLVPNGRVLAIEPSAYQLSILRLMLFFTRTGQVDVIDKGIGRQQGTAILQTPLKKSGVFRYGLSHIHTASVEPSVDTVKSEQIVVTTIDALSAQYAVDSKLSLIKADIEGYEYEMLCGATSSVDSYKPSFMLEISDQRNEILQFLSDRGYVVFDLLNYGGKRREALRLYQVPEPSDSTARNILAVHRSRQRCIERIGAAFCSITA